MLLQKCIFTQEIIGKAMDKNDAWVVKCFGCINRAENDSAYDLRPPPDPR